MARLPQPGGDSGNWGAILNDYLAQSHKPDGTIKDNAVTSSALAPDSVNATAIADGSITSAQLQTALQTQVSGALQANNNLSDVNNAATSRTNLGLGTAATRPTTDFEAAGRVAAAAPIRFAATTAVVGVTPSDRAYVARTLTGARMRTASAPSGSALTVQVQYFNGGSWTTVGTLTIASGSMVESVISFTQAQSIGDLVRLNVTSVGSTTAATGVVVDVLWS